MKTIKSVLRGIFSVYIGISLFLGMSFIPELFGDDVFKNTGIAVWAIAFLIVSIILVLWTFDYSFKDD